MMRRLLIGGGIALAVLLIFWIGLMVHFPGEALSTFAERRMGAALGRPVTLSPATLRGLSISVARIDIPPLPGSAARVGGVTLSNVRLSLLGMGTLPLRAQNGDTGRLSASWSWLIGSVQLNAANVPLEALAGLGGSRAIRVQGLLSLQARLGSLPAGPPRTWQRLPEGAVSGQLQDMTMQGFEAVGQPLPPLSLARVEFSAALGENIEITQVALTGDIDGQLSGQLTPRMAQLGQSRINLQVQATPKPAWLQQLGGMQPVVQGFLQDGRLEAALQGTLANPSFRPTRSS